MDIVDIEHIADRLALLRLGAFRDFHRLQLGLFLRLPAHEEGGAAQNERAGHEGHEGQAGEDGEARHQRRHRGQSRRIARQLLEHGGIGRALGATARQQDGRADRDDHGRDLAGQTVADGEDRIGFQRAAQRHVMHDRADGKADDKVQKRDQQTGDGIALDEFRRTVKRAEEGRFRLFLFAPRPGLGMIDGAGVHVAVDGQLLAGHRVEGKTGADFGHPARALGDHDEVHDHDHAKDDQPDHHRAAHDEIGESLDHVTGGGGAGMAIADDQLGRGDVQRQSQHQRGEQDRRKGREIQRPFDEQRDGEDQDGQREGHRQTGVENPGRNRQDHHHDHGHQGDGQQNRRLEDRRKAQFRHQFTWVLSREMAKRLAPGAPPSGGETVPVRRSSG